MNHDQCVNTAIIGLGRWGRNLVESVATNPDGRLRFIRAMTRTPEKAIDFCNLHGLNLSGDFDALLSDDSVEAVALATPHSKHCEQICAAANAGKHVFVEKPLALTVDEANRAISACNHNGVVLAVGFNRRYLPGYRKMCDQFRSGALGHALHMDGNFSGPFGYDYSNEMWRGTASENPAGGMAAMGIHMLDAMIHLLGPVSRVATISKRRVLTAEIDDVTTVQLEFQNGATGCLTSLMATAGHWRLQLFGSKGWAAMPDQEQLELRFLGDSAADIQSYPAGDTLAAELDDFALAIRQRSAYAVTLPEALAGVAAMQAISISANSNGKSVAVAN